MFSKVFEGVRCSSKLFEGILSCSKVFEDVFKVFEAKLRRILLSESRIMFLNAAIQSLRLDCLFILLSEATIPLGNCEISLQIWNFASKNQNHVPKCQNQSQELEFCFSKPQFLLDTAGFLFQDGILLLTTRTYSEN